MSDTLDIGVIDAPLFIFGGPYSNLAATKRVLEIAQAHDIAPRNVVCTGDVVAYCAHAAESVAAVREAGIHVVMGNCEESLGEQLDDCGCGFEEGTACDVLSRSWFTYANARMDDDARAWMRGLPRTITGSIAGRRFAIIHGDSHNISGWVFASTPATAKQAHFEALDVDMIIGGHCGLPFIEQLADGRVWLNAGVVGMPANDGTPRGWYAVLTPDDDGGLTVTLDAFHYDTSSEVEAMNTFGLPVGYRDALDSGLWPNMDVLPETEQKQRGIALTSTTLTIPGVDAVAAE